MRPANVHCYLVRPHRGQEEEPQEIRYTTIAMETRTWRFLSDVFEKSGSECDIDIDFISDENLGQQNTTRNAMIQYFLNPVMENGIVLAEILGLATPGNSGLGLLFLMTGQRDNRHRLVISRFPADSGLVADDTGDELEVNFIEKLFLKDRHQYKCVLYEAAEDGINLIWNGRAVDRQDKSSRMVSNYWIQRFLKSDFSSTSLRGSRDLAEGIKNAYNMSDSLTVRSEIQSLLNLLHNINGQQISAGQLAGRFNLSEETSQSIKKGMKRNTFGSVFLFNSEEFKKVTPYRTIQLNNGVNITAPADQFDEVVTQTHEDNGEVTLSASGQIQESKLRKGK